MTKRNRWVAVLVGVLVLSLFAGCNQLDENQIFSVRNRKSGKILTIGDTMETVEKVTGGEEQDVIDFEEDQVHRASYWNAEGVLVDTFEDHVVGLRLVGTDAWEISNGVRIGMDKEEVLALYADEPYREEGMKGGVLLSYDKDRNPIPFDEESHYMIVISFSDDLVDYVGIQTRIAELTLKERAEAGQESAEADQSEADQSEADQVEADQA